MVSNKHWSHNNIEFRMNFAHKSYSQKVFFCKSPQNKWALDNLQRITQTNRKCCRHKIRKLSINSTKSNVDTIVSLSIVYLFKLHVKVLTIVLSTFYRYRRRRAYFFVCIFYFILSLSILLFEI